MILTELMKLKKADLQEQCKSLNLPSYERLSKKDLATSIIAEKAKIAALQESEQGGDDAEPVETTELVVIPHNPDFQNVDVTAEPEPKQRGGAREGAGRPVGSTADVCEVRDLPEQPNEAIKAALQAAFAMWSLKVGIDEVNLTEQEAIDLALPITQIMELHFPGMIPQWLFIYITAAWTTWSITKAKVEIINAVKQTEAPEKKEAVENAA